ncbi:MULTISPECIES: hypothetical protein [Klebsiella]|uniref:hypothetical protein n=1 Tax=Klebsiella TaxID=570 RepID=UPI001CCC7224|nr:hypothetical protein [Klebsiella oxytoca]EJG2193371.1 hypothetical protein [Klebsiella oxytoca]EKZ9478279.1 hypothetical protein [Klebsiella oxytoca]ELJ5741436.1 hypothetical protein [Klebsiella oxytoca]MBZ7165207.1 hypothetical protein [Klebsiella oxytoca]WKM72924.1 hypothetical protein Q2T70_04015 [Klebsiella oxytoca]
MDKAKTRNSGIAFVGRHLLASAHQALVKTKQSSVAKLLGVHDSTVMRRTEKYPEIMDQLAASGVEDFVMRGERKLPLEHYRWLMTVAMEFAKLQLEITEKEKAPEGESFEA